MKWLIILLWIASAIGGVSEHDVLLYNTTGIPIIRIEIGKKVFEGSGAAPITDLILVNVPPGTHHLKVVFRGGADVEWPAFDWRHIKEVIFKRDHNQITAITG